MYAHRILRRGGLAGLALWGGPLIWVANAQDLWMLVFGLLFLRTLERYWISLPALVLALLSKETAAVLPAIGLAASVLVWRRPLLAHFGHREHSDRPS